MKFKTPLFNTIFLSLFLFIKLDNLTPLSFCTKGRISPYNNWKNGGSCGFGSHLNAVGPSYLYPVAPNQDLFRDNDQCGVCYEMVGPYGAIKVKVEDYCSKNNELEHCSGDMFHFNIANNSVSYIMGNETVSNISFRMISCDYLGNIRILTDDYTDNIYLSFVILDHNLAVSYIEIKESNSKKWEKKSRDKNNYWVYYISNGSTFAYPIFIKIYSINGDYVNLTLNETKPKTYYEANGNFIVPKNTYFDISTLEKINNIPNDVLKNCCELDKSDFTPIYKDGNLNKIYKNNSQNVEVIYNSEDKYLDKYSLKAIFGNNGNLNFKSTFPIRTEQFLGISFTIKCSKVCDNCLQIRAYDLNDNSQIINFNKENIWSNYNFTFEDLGIQNNQFNGIIFDNKLSNENLEINIENIQLIPNLHAPNVGICFDTQNKNNSDIPIHENTPLINNTDLNNINNINIYDNSPNILNINCQRPISNENNKIILKFKSKDNNFDIDKCDIPNTKQITSFNCTLPNNLLDGKYNINIQLSNGLNINYSKTIEIKKGIIICGNEDINSKMTSFPFSEEYYSPLIIIHSKEQIINKGDLVTFNIYPIPQQEYYLDNDEIILFSNDGRLPLYLKYCNPNTENKIIISIKCTVSNNIIRGNYTLLYSNQTASLLDGQRINLISLNSNGGVIIENNTREVESNLSKERKSSYNLIFNVLYYNPNVRAGDEFPHRIYLYGVKKNSNEKQLEENYDSRIILSNCTVKNSPSDDSNALTFIDCKMPNFVSAGIYTKLECDGLDINPKNSISLFLKEDFNKSTFSYSYSNSTNKDIGINDNDDDEKESSSSSSGVKEWIIWVIVVILAILLVVLVIIIMACKKNDNEDSSEQKENNDSKAAANTTSD